MVSKNSEARKCANTSRASIENNRVGNIDMYSVQSNALTFQQTAFHPVSHAGETWLTSSELAAALGYKKSDAVTQIFSRYQDEFTEKMSTTLKMSVVRKTGVVDIPVRVFSLRGAHLVAMFASTPTAKEFRRWVLDLLDCEVHKGSQAREMPEFHQRVMLYMDEHGRVISSMPLQDDAVAMTFEGFLGLAKKKGWIVAREQEVARSLLGVLQGLH